MSDTVSVSNDVEVVLDGKKTWCYCRDVKFTEKRVLIIGGSSGIGWGTAQAALAEGAQVIIAGRSSEKLEEAKRALGAAEAVQTQTVDITEEETVARLFHSIGAVDHIVITAVDARYTLIAEASLEDIYRVIDSKLVGALLVAKHGAKQIRGGGSLTFTSGIAAERPAPRGAMVAAVNGALNALARALALELAPVRVNTISPGWVDTPLWAATFGADKARLQTGMASRLPVRRIGTADEIATAILFLLAHEFTTGSVLHVDGGHALV